MKNFRDLQKKHELLLKSKQAGEDIVKEVESYIEATINAGQDITDSFQREQLRANNRYWGNYIYEMTGAFPKTDIDPPSEKALLRRKFNLWLTRGLTLLTFSITTLVLYQLFFTSPPAPRAKPIVCTPQAPNVNIYRVTQVPTSATLIPNGVVPNETSGVTTSMSAEQALALLQETPLPGIPVAGSNDSYIILGTLVNETKTWSDIQTIELDDSNRAQIVVTFLSPQLIQAVYNSEISSRGSAVSSPQSVLEAIAARDELIFFVTVITTTNNNLKTTPHRIEIPFNEMVMFNADDVDAPPLHDDLNLSQPIDSSLEPVFGYLTYPIAIMHGDECSWILDPSYNKRIIISIPSIYVDGVSTGPFTWIIPYSSIFQSELPSTPPSNITIDPNLVTNSQMPPLPMATLLNPGGLPENTFWQIYAGFLWKQVVLGMY